VLAQKAIRESQQTKKKTGINRIVAMERKTGLSEPAFHDLAAIFFS
jgi:hypothetical protein